MRGLAIDNSAASVSSEARAKPGPPAADVTDPPDIVPDEEPARMFGGGESGRIPLPSESNGGARGGMPPAWASGRGPARWRARPVRATAHGPAAGPSVPGAAQPSAPITLPGPEPGRSVDEGPALAAAPGRLASDPPASAAAPVGLSGAGAGGKGASTLARACDAGPPKGIPGGSPDMGIRRGMPGTLGRRSGSPEAVSGEPSIAPTNSSLVLPTASVTPATAPPAPIAGRPPPESVSRARRNTSPAPLGAALADSRACGRSARIAARAGALSGCRAS